jgi:hypothetical protein
MFGVFKIVWCVVCVCVCVCASVCVCVFSVFEIVCVGVCVCILCSVSSRLCGVYFHVRCLRNHVVCVFVFGVFEIMRCVFVVGVCGRCLWSVFSSCVCVCVCMCSASSRLCDVVRVFGRDYVMCVCSVSSRLCGLRVCVFVRCLRDSMCVFGVFEIM